MKIWNFNIILQNYELSTLGPPALSLQATKERIKSSL